ncbi:MAG: biotin-dependent carboxyltransferase family protein [Rhodospirillales bacterium]
MTLEGRLAVLSAGPCVTLQDRGRPGFQRYGVAEGGALDPYALAEGAALLGNSLEAAAIECFALGGRFQAVGQSLRFALTGAVMTAAKLTADGHRESLQWRSSGRLLPGETLEIGAAVEGQVGYLHIGGGIATEPQLGSRATHLRAGIGAPRLDAGQSLPLGPDQGETVGMVLPDPGYLARREIRLLWGPQAEVFAQAERDRLLEASYRVSAKRDRMGARLEGPALHAEGQLTGLSDAVSLGDVQVPGDGAPLVLLADRQPTGGYPRIATVITADLAAFAQLPSGAAFSFRLVAEEEALSALKAWRAEIAGLAGRVAPLLRDPRAIPDLLSYNLVDGVVTGREESS